MAADGSIIIDSRIRDDGFVEGTKRLEDAMKHTAATVQGLGEKQRAALQKQVSSFSELNRKYAEQSSRVEELKRQISEMGRQKVETKEYSAIDKEIEELSNKIAAAEAKKRKFLSTGGSESSAAFKKMEYDTSLLAASMDRALEKKKQLESSGGAYTGADTSALESKLATEQAKLEQTGSRLNNSYASLRANMNAYGDSTQKATSRTSVFKSALQRLAGIAKGLVSALSNIAKKGLSAIASGAKKAGEAILGVGGNANKSEGGLKSSLKTMIRYGFGVESLFALVRKLRTALVEGMKDLAQYSNSANKSISSMQSSVATLKNSVAAAFAPILSVVAPVVSALINMLATAISYIGAFFAALSGKSTYTKAIAVQKDFAGSLKDTASAAGGAAGAMQDYLSGLDEIKKFDEGSGGGGGGGASAGSTGPLFEEAQIPGLATDWAAKFKEAWSEADFSEIGVVVGEKLNNALERIPWTGIKDTCYRTASSVATFINGFVATKELWENVGGTIANAINTAVGTVHTFFKVTDWKQVGTALVTTLNTAIDKTNWKNIGSTIGLKIQAALDVIGTTLEEFDWDELSGSISNFVNGVFSEINIPYIGTTLSNAFNGIVRFASGLISGIDWNGITSGFVALINNAINGISWTDIGTSIGDVVGLIIDGFKTIMDQTDWSGLGKGLADAINSAIQSITSADFLGSLQSAVRAITEFLLTVVLNIDWGYIAGSLVDSLAWAVNSMFEKMGLKPFISTDFSTEWSNYGNEVGTSFADAIKASLSGLPKDTQKTANSAYTNALGAWSYAKRDYKKVAGNIEGGFADLDVNTADTFASAYEDSKAQWNKATSDYTVVAGKISGTFDALPRETSSKFGTAYRQSKQTWGTAASDFSNTSRAVASSFNSLPSGVAGKFTEALTQAKRAWSSVTSGFHSISNQVIAGFSTLAAGVEIKFNSAYTAAKGAFSAATSDFAAIASGIVSAFNGVGSQITSKIISGMYTTSGLYSWGEWFKSYVSYYLPGGTIGYNLTLGIVYGMYTTDGLGNWASWFISAVKSKLGIHSPSKLFKEEVGFFLGTGIGEGLLDSTRSVLNNVSALAEKIVDGFTEGLSELTIPNSVAGVFPNVNIPTPELATGSIIPPKTVYTQEAQEVGQKLSGLADTLSRLTNGGGAASSNTYNFTAQINRRTLFEEMIEEARMVQSQTGLNPFGL